ncbi:MAG: DUF1232 domain-containing protein [Anaerolineaceae bacterium]|nr:DUF1232 domain-containing protein [Anaerolineaceae bacterium]
MLQKWKDRARSIKRDVYGLCMAYRDARTPRYAKVFAALVVAYAFSPIDLIPDFIPVLGYLDDLLLLPLGIVLAIKLIPPQVMADAHQQAADHMLADRPTSRFGAVMVVLIWLALAALGIWLMFLR